MPVVQLAQVAAEIFELVQAVVSFELVQAAASFELVQAVALLAFVLACNEQEIPA